MGNMVEVVEGGGRGFDGVMLRHHSSRRLMRVIVGKKSELKAESQHVEEQCRRIILLGQQTKVEV